MAKSPVTKHQTLATTGKYAQKSFGSAAKPENLAKGGKVKSGKKC